MDKYNDFLEDLKKLLYYCNKRRDIRTIPKYIIKWIYKLSKNHIKNNKTYNVLNKHIIDFVDSMEPTTLVPSYYDRTINTDFKHMITNPIHKYDLFIFNDNEEDYYKNHIGGGNATIRPFKKKDPPQSWGIVTGSKEIFIRIYYINYTKIFICLHTYSLKMIYIVPSSRFL